MAYTIAVAFMQSVYQTSKLSYNNSLDAVCLLRARQKCKSLWKRTGSNLAATVLGVTRDGVTPHASYPSSLPQTYGPEAGN
jgi:hypothetical protein